MSATGATSSVLGDLVVPTEPVELRQGLRVALLEGASWEVQFGPESGVGELLWSAWHEVLTAGGMTRERFAAVVEDYGRELWFWVFGDRTWDQAATGLAGRLLRRLPSA